MPSTVLNGLSRYEKLYKKKPKINHLHFFSSLGYAKVLLSVDKFVERSVACVMMRYSLTQKGYWFMHMQTKVFFVSQDVKFS